MDYDLNSEPFFLVDEELIELEAILSEVQFKLNNPDIDKNKLILRSFVRACSRASKRKIPMEPSMMDVPIPEPPKPTKKKKGIFRIIKHFKKSPAGKEVFPIPAPSAKKIKKFKSIQRFKKEKIKTKLPVSQIPLIQDNITNKPLALADVNEKYVVREPSILPKEIFILKNAIKRRPESPKEAWKLLQRLAPNMPEDRLTNIKYYLINSLFSLGRLEPLFHDDKITEIKCEGVGELVKIKRNNKALKTNIIFSDKEDLENYIRKSVRKLGKRIDELDPIVDIVDKGFRFHFILGLYGASSKFSIKRIE